MNNETQVAHRQVIALHERVLVKFKNELAKVDKYPETIVGMYKVFNGSLTVVAKPGVGVPRYELAGNPDIMDGIFTRKVAEVVARKVNKQSQTEIFRPMSYREWLCENIDIYERLIHYSRMELTQLR